MRLKNLSKYAAIAGAVAAPLAFAAAPASATTGGSTAFGVAASGLVTIPRTPAVSSTGQPNDKSFVELPANPLVELKVLHVTAAAARARASVVDLKLANAQLRAHLVTAKCDGGNGSSDLAKAYLAGHRLAVHAAPNSTVSVPLQGLGTASVVLNKQVRNADGGITVTAIEVNLPLPAGKSQTISISSVTCGGGTAGGPGSPGGPGAPGSPGGPTTTPSPSPAPGTPTGEAPKPTPVPGNLPVTG